jgi:hypothetical protein
MEQIVANLGELVTRVLKLLVRGRLNADQRADIASNLRRLADKFEQVEDY